MMFDEWNNHLVYWYRSVMYHSRKAWELTLEKVYKLCLDYFPQLCLRQHLICKCGFCICHQKWLFVLNLNYLLFFIFICRKLDEGKYLILKDPNKVRRRRSTHTDGLSQASWRLPTLSTASDPGVQPAWWDLQLWRGGGGGGRWGGWGRGGWGCSLMLMPPAS